MHSLCILSLKNAWLPTFCFLDSNIPCRGLPFLHSHNLCKKTSVLVGTVLNGVVGTYDCLRKRRRRKNKNNRRKVTLDTRTQNNSIVKIIENNLIVLIFLLLIFVFFSDYTTTRKISRVLV